jgi:hypothetical protein
VQISDKQICDADGQDSCVRDLGLVGFHIAHKVHAHNLREYPDEPSAQWVWSTFEHVNNAPIEGDVTAGKKYNFYTPDCKTATGQACEGEYSYSGW